MLSIFYPKVSDLLVISIRLHICLSLKCNFCQLIGKRWQRNSQVNTRKGISCKCIKSTIVTFKSLNKLDVCNIEQKSESRNKTYLFVGFQRNQMCKSTTFNVACNIIGLQITQRSFGCDCNANAYTASTIFGRTERVIFRY